MTDGWTTDDLVFLWKEGDPVQVVKNLHLPRFTLEKFLTDYCNSKTNTGTITCQYQAPTLCWPNLFLSFLSLCLFLWASGHPPLVSSAGEYSCLKVDLLFKREFSYYLIQIYIPCCMLVIVSWVSFWLDQGAVPARVSLGKYCWRDYACTGLTTLPQPLSLSLPQASPLYWQWPRKRPVLMHRCRPCPTQRPSMCGPVSVWRSCSGRCSSSPWSTTHLVQVCRISYLHCDSRCDFSCYTLWFAVKYLEMRPTPSAGCPSGLSAWRRPTCGC